jgi:hypothetical protein
VQNSQTIRVERLESLPAILMAWSAHPRKDDIHLAYQDIMSYLQASEQALFVVIDLRFNVTMHLSETVSGALNGLYQHPKLVAWLVIGGHQTARTIANIIRRITNQDRFLWFKDEAELCAYLKDQNAGNGT